MTNTLPLLLPTVPDMVSGIVSLDPFTLQCADCGDTASGERPASTVILSGFHFHVCEGRDGVRRCPTCLTAVKKACPSGRCKR